MSASTRQKAVLILAGLVFSLCLLEIGMRSCGWWFTCLQEKRNQRTDSDGEATVILCIGESTTAWGGDDSYPAQLQDILNAIQAQRRFRVINKGMPASTTDEILDVLPRYLTQYKPDYVLAMVGINDVNFDLNRARRDSHPGLYAAIEKLRVYRLFAWIADTMRFRKAMQREIPGNQPLDEARRVVANEALERVTTQDEFSLWLKRIFLVEYNPLTIQNLNAMVALTARRGVAIVFVQYPLRKVSVLKEALYDSNVRIIDNYGIFEDALKKYGYDVVCWDRFAYDIGHLTKLGNKVLAENIAHHLLSIMPADDE